MKNISKNKLKVSMTMFMLSCMGAVIHGPVKGENSAGTIARGLIGFNVNPQQVCPEALSQLIGSVDFAVLTQYPQVVHNFVGNLPENSKNELFNSLETKFAEDQSIPNLVALLTALPKQGQEMLEQRLSRYETFWQLYNKATPERIAEVAKAIQGALPADGVVAQNLGRLEKIISSPEDYEVETFYNAEGKRMVRVMKKDRDQQAPSTGAESASSEVTKIIKASKDITKKITELANAISVALSNQRLSKGEKTEKIVAHLKQMQEHGSSMYAVLYFFGNFSSKKIAQIQNLLPKGSEEFKFFQHLKATCELLNAFKDIEDSDSAQEVAKFNEVLKEKVKERQGYLMAATGLVPSITEVVRTLYRRQNVTGTEAVTFELLARLLYVVRNIDGDYDKTTAHCDEIAGLMLDGRLWGNPDLISKAYNGLPHDIQASVLRVWGLGDKLRAITDTKASELLNAEAGQKKTRNTKGRKKANAQQATTSVEANATVENAAEGAQTPNAQMVAPQGQEGPQVFSMATPPGSGQNSGASTPQVKYAYIGDSYDRDNDPSSTASTPRSLYEAYAFNQNHTGGSSSSNDATTDQSPSRRPVRTAWADVSSDSGEEGIGPWGKSDTDSTPSTQKNATPTAAGSSSGGSGSSGEELVVEELEDSSLHNPHTLYGPTPTSSLGGTPSERFYPAYQGVNPAAVTLRLDALLSQPSQPAAPSQGGYPANRTQPAGNVQMPRSPQQGVRSQAPAELLGLTRPVGQAAQATATAPTLYPYDVICTTVGELQARFGDVNAMVRKLRDYLENTNPQATQSGELLSNVLRHLQQLAGNAPHSEVDGTHFTHAREAVTNCLRIVDTVGFVNRASDEELKKLNELRVALGMLPVGKQPRPVGLQR